MQKMQRYRGVEGGKLHYATVLCYILLKSLCN